MLGVNDVAVEVVLIRHLVHLAEAGSVGNADCAVATMIRYMEAPETPCQRSVGFVAIPIAPFVGLLSMGAGKMFSVVKLDLLDQYPPKLPSDRTCQK